MTERVIRNKSLSFTARSFIVAGLVASTMFVIGINGLPDFGINELPLRTKIVFYITVVVLGSLRGAMCVQLTGLIFQPYNIHKIKVLATFREFVFVEVLLLILAFIWLVEVKINGFEYPTVVLKSIGWCVLMQIITMLQAKVEQEQRLKAIHTEFLLKFKRK